MHFSVLGILSCVCMCVFSSVSFWYPLYWFLPYTGLQTPIPEVIVDMDSMDIFPVGWCEANFYPLTTPHKTVCKCCPVE